VVTTMGNKIENRWRRELIWSKRKILLERFPNEYISKFCILKPAGIHAHSNFHKRTAL